MQVFTQPGSIPYGFRSPTPRQLYPQQRKSQQPREIDVKGHERTLDVRRRTARSRPKAVPQVDQYFLTIGVVGTGAGAAAAASGENDKVTQTFQPAGRFWALNSLYPLMFR